MALIGLAVLSISILASAFAPSLQFLLTLRVLTGWGGGAIPPNIVGAVSDAVSQARRAQAVGALLAIQGLASAITVPFCSGAGRRGWLAVCLHRLWPGAGGGASGELALASDRPAGASSQLGGSFPGIGRWLHAVFGVAVAVNLTQRIAF